LPFTVRTKKQLQNVLEDHCRDCTCGEFVTIIRRRKHSSSTHKKTGFSLSYPELCSPTTAASVELAQYVVLGNLRLGQYELKLWKTIIPPQCSANIIYVTGPPQFFIRFATFDTRRSIAEYYGLDTYDSPQQWMQQLAVRIHTEKNWYSCQFQAMEEVTVSETRHSFPPRPASKKVLMSIARDYIEEFAPENVEESGCVVCAQLTLKKMMRPVAEVQEHFGILMSSYTRRERLCNTDNICTLPGPVLATGCSLVCPDCCRALFSGKKPVLSLSNGLWIGEIPTIFRDLTFAEKLIISKIRHNRCLVKVSSGRCKMIANIVMYSNPTIAVYDILPPPRSDLQEVLAFLFIGSSPPTIEDFCRTPMLVRRNVVKRILSWLTLNHSDYHTVQISQENLEGYPECGIPVEVISRTINESEGNVLSSELSVHDNVTEKGAEVGPCPFTVNGVTGEELEEMSPLTMKAIALRHLQRQGKVLAIGRSLNPESMYDNPQAYPQMFPWLFPYGLGGIGQKMHKGLLGEQKHKRWLLMYYDKRFQTDPYFPMVAFNHSQIKNAVTGSFLTASASRFSDVVNRLNRLDTDVLIGIITRLTEGKKVIPLTEEEKLCYSILRDVDHVGGHVRGRTVFSLYGANIY
jgi:hypothetical protein